MVSADAAHSRRVALLTSLRKGREYYLKSCLQLMEALANKDYKTLGYDRAEDFFKHELNLKPSTGWNMVGVAVHLGTLLMDPNLLESIPQQTRLTQLLPVVRNTTDTNKVEWLKKAVELDPDKFNSYLREMKGKVPPDMCEHPEHEKELWSRCRACEKWEKISDPPKEVR